MNPTAPSPLSGNLQFSVRIFDAHSCSTKTYLLLYLLATGTYYTIGRVVPGSARSSKHTLLLRDSLLFCMCMLCVFYCARPFSSLGGRGRREVGRWELLTLELLNLELLTLELLTLKLLTLELLTLELLTLELLTLAPIAYFGTKESNCLLSGRLASFE
jgi:hypothetical protein